MLAVAAMAAFSCAKETENQNDVVKPEVKTPLVITAYADDDIAPDTKTSLDGVSVVWSTEDAVAGYKSSDVNPHNSTVTAVDGTGKKATFTFSDLTVGTDVTYLIYPAFAAGKEGTAGDAGKYNITLPATQNATANSFANGANLAIADGSVDANAVQFKNIGALLGFTISNSNVASVEISANEDMTGHALVTPGSPVVPTVAKDGISYVELTGGITSGTQYYAVVYPGTYTGLTIKVTDNDGKMATYTNPTTLELNRNDNLQIADLTVADGKWKTLSRTNWSYTFESKQYSANGTQELNGQNWNLAGDGGYWGYEAARGQQLGSGSAPYRNLTLTSDFGVEKGIDEIIVNAAAGGTATISVSVGGHVFECESKTSANLTSSNAAYDFKSIENKKYTGKIVISIKQPSTSKACYIKAIEVNPMPVVATPEISIESNTATISCSTEGATIHYTTNGTMPTSTSTTYSTPFSVAAGITVKAIAVKDGYRDSEIASKTNGNIAIYTFNTDEGIAALGIAKPGKGKGTDLSTSSPYVVNGVSMAVENGSTNTRVWNSSGALDLRIYKSGGSLTFSVTSGDIKSIVMAGTTVNNFSYSGEKGTFSAGTWTSSASTSTVCLSATDTGKINTITVLYTD